MIQKRKKRRKSIYSLCFLLLINYIYICRQLFICLTATKYECMHRVAKKLNFKEVGDDEEWCLYWTDTSVSIDRVNQMKRWQKINHFPGMSEICRKDFLTRNMNRMLKLFPKEYSFYPRAWCLPAE
jgi:tubulin polyglutamylase TTLL6/13